VPIQATTFFSFFRRRSSASTAQSGHGRALGVAESASHARTVRGAQGRCVYSAIRLALSTWVMPDCATTMMAERVAILEGKQRYGPRFATLFHRPLVRSRARLEA
jgi:hypothetical protein